MFSHLHSLAEKRVIGAGVTYCYMVSANVRGRKKNKGFKRQQLTGLTILAMARRSRTFHGESMSGDTRRHRTAGIHYNVAERIDDRQVIIMLITAPVQE